MGTTNFDTVQASSFLDSAGNSIGGGDLAIANTKILIGDASGVSQEFALSGDVTMTAGGVVTIAANAVETSMIKGGNVTAGKMIAAEGAILRGAAGGTAMEELAKGSANQILAMDGGGGFPGYYTVGGDVTQSTGTFTISNSIVQIATFNINASGIKNLAATPIAVIAAPGVGKGIVFEGATLKLVAGSEAFTESTYNLAFRYTDGSGVIVSDAVETTGFIDQVANTVTNAVPIKDAIVAQTGMENQALVLDNIGGGEIAGNASNDGELRVTVKYRTIIL